MNELVGIAEHLGTNAVAVGGLWLHVLQGLIELRNVGLLNLLCRLSDIHTLGVQSSFDTPPLNLAI